MPISTITVAGINPGLNILGNTQQFNYTQSLSTFQITNSFIPSAFIPSQFNQEFRNNLFSGFRLSHITTNTDTYGSLTLQSFVNAQSTGSDIIKFNSTGIDIFKTINLNNSPGTSGQVLTSQGVGALPIWTTNGSGTVTSITAGAGLSGGTITTSGTIDITDTAVAPATYNGPYTVNSRGQITAASNILSGVLASLYMSGNNTPTSITIAETFTKISGTTTAGPLNGFTAAIDNRCTYIGTDTITAKVTVDLSARPILQSTLGIAIYKNGSLIPSENYSYQVTGGKPISLTVNTSVEFDTTDYVEAFIVSDNVDVVTVSNMNLLISI